MTPAMRETFGALLRELDACTSAAGRRGVPSSELPDLAQLGRLAAWRAARRGARFEDITKMRCWWGRVGRRLAAMHHRQQRQVPVPRDPLEVAADAPSVPDAESVALARAPEVLLDEALAELERRRPELFAVLDAHYRRGQPMTEIAVRQGIPANTAWNRLRLGRNFLRAHVARA